MRKNSKSVTEPAFEKADKLKSVSITPLKSRISIPNNNDSLQNFAKRRQSSNPSIVKTNQSPLKLDTNSPSRLNIHRKTISPIIPTSTTPIPGQFYGETLPDFQIGRKNTTLTLKHPRVSMVILRPQLENTSSEQPEPKPNLTKEQERKTIHKHRADVEYFKNKFTKKNCNLSILDFWSKDMITVASKLSKKNKVVVTNPNFVLPELKRKESVTNGIGMGKDWKESANYGICLKKINEICDKTLEENLNMKNKITQILEHL
jgi:hypothetical protein